jgi:hypothetical protein
MNVCLGRVHAAYEVRFVLDQHTELDFYSASSLKQQFADRRVCPLGHIILIPSRPEKQYQFYSLVWQPRMLL